MTKEIQYALYVILGGYLSDRYVCRLTKGGDPRQNTARHSTTPKTEKEQDALCVSSVSCLITIMALVELLGESLQKKAKDDEKLPTSSLAGEGRFVGLYFSAHWCPPCRLFTPELVNFYNDFKAKGTLEIVFVSSDADQGSFDGYFGSMPWLAVPYSDRQRKAELTRTFDVKGIPTLVILKADTAEVVTKRGRDRVMKDPTGQDFPWG
ncbi:PREDICTED: tryparedoxin-like [Branchiostoma belcheri]|uniref:Nucleoredoxin n=1 Tax=Branchiostoma belcheri TaxID=7741 RepID=A0A6P4ZS14_BRABE|nr:PREDICTED: tryparedoxin-like [Branchiostoma belcheri]